MRSIGKRRRISNSGELGVKALAVAFLMGAMGSAASGTGTGPAPAPPPPPGGVTGNAKYPVGSVITLGQDYYLVYGVDSAANYLLRPIKPTGNDFLEPISFIDNNPLWTILVPKYKSGDVLQQIVDPANLIQITSVTLTDYWVNDAQGFQFKLDIMYVDSSSIWHKVN